MESEDTSNEITIDATISREVSFAGHQNSVPLIRDLTIKNGSGKDLNDLTLRMTTSPDFVSPKDWKISTISAGDEINLRDRNTLLNGNFPFETG